MRGYDGSPILILGMLVAGRNSNAKEIKRLASLTRFRGTISFRFSSPTAKLHDLIGVAFNLGKSLGPRF